MATPICIVGQCWFTKGFRKRDGSVGEVQTTLNKKIGLKSFRTVDFALRFIFFIKFKFKIHTFNNHYES
jgi:hypothetical protein